MSVAKVHATGPSGPLCGSDTHLLTHDHSKVTCHSCRHTLKVRHTSAYKLRRLYYVSRREVGE